MSIKIRLGEKMAPEEAKAVVDELYRKVAERWEAKVKKREVLNGKPGVSLPFRSMPGISTLTGRERSRRAISP